MSLPASAAAGELRRSWRTRACRALLSAVVPLAACALPASPLSLVPPAVLALVLWPHAAGAQPAPEAASGFKAAPTARAGRFMVATANPLATDAAWQVLAAGGTAVDAAVAAQMMLTLVEPQSSGIGGGAFLLHFDARSGSIAAWDGRETAPMAADERLFLDAGGKPMPFFSAVVGGRSVGVPGVVRMLEAAHREAGRMRWSELLQPAIDKARDGFAVSPRLHALIGADPFLRDDPVAAAYFHGADGKPLAIGTTLRNPALARTLQTVARDGSRAFYSGELAGAIVDKVRSHPRNPGLLTRGDLAVYQSRRREPVCSPWQRWIVCGMPPPSSGGMAVAQMLQILAALPFRGLVAAGPDLASAASAQDARTPPHPSLDPAGVHLFSEAGRLAFADRDRYVADSDYVPVPAGLLDSGYLRQRAQLVGEQSLGVAAPGVPNGIGQSARERNAGYEEGGTSHISVVDSYGNAASMTTSIENAFGSRQMVAGFLLNNQLTDFSFAAAPAAMTAPNAAAGPAPAPGVRNRLQPGKRPRSSMAPTLVFEQAQPQGGRDDTGASPARGPLVMVTGSPGGSAIINYVAKTVIATLQDGLDPLQAIALPNIGSRNGPTELERGRVDDALVAALKARGHPLRILEATSGVQSIVRRCDGGIDTTVASSGNGVATGCTWIGAADPRREGTARGG